MSVGMSYWQEDGHLGMLWYVWGARQLCTNGRNSVLHLVGHVSVDWMVAAWAGDVF